MNISPIGQPMPVTRQQGSGGVNGSQGSQEVSRPRQDTVEISDMARYLSEIKKLPDVRQEKVDAARSAISAGTYETPEKLDTTVSRLLGEVGG
jgi:flagellar biosynthesis anti-sigma factor FlgM